MAAKETKEIFKADETDANKERADYDQFIEYMRSLFKAIIQDISIEYDGMYAYSIEASNLFIALAAQFKTKLQVGKSYTFNIRDNDYAYISSVSGKLIYAMAKYGIIVRVPKPSKNKDAYVVHEHKDYEAVFIFENSVFSKAPKKIDEEKIEICNAANVKLAYVIAK